MHGSSLKMAGDTSQQFTTAERFDQIIIGTVIEAFDPRFFAGPGGEQYHRHRAKLGIGTQFFQQREAVHHRHHDIGQDEVGTAGTGGGQRGLAVRDCLDLVEIG